MIFLGFHFYRLFDTTESEAHRDWLTWPHAESARRRLAAAARPLRAATPPRAYSSAAARSSRKSSDSACRSSGAHWHSRRLASLSDAHSRAAATALLRCSSPRLSTCACSLSSARSLRRSRSACLSAASGAIVTLPVRRIQYAPFTFRPWCRTCRARSSSLTVSASLLTDGGRTIALPRG